ncbi:MAG: trypsin-like serine peptidase [Silvanigrellaceae bacterium]
MYKKSTVREVQVFYAHDGPMFTLFTMKGTTMKRGQTLPSFSSATLLIAATALVTACGTGTSDRAVRKLQGPNGSITYVSSYNSPNVIEKIIGSNELTPVLEDGANIPAKYRPLIDAFGKISMGCTATHIGNGLVITAGHCFEAPEKRINNKPCDKVTVDWGYRKDKAPYLKSKCTMILAAELNDSRDYAIFRVDVAPTAKVDVDLSAKPKFGSSITIFGHPQLRPLEWSQTCTVENTSNGGWGEDEFSHQCDTEPGNSGSTIIDDTTLKVIGIHDGGRVPWNYGTFILNTPILEFVGGGSTPTNPNPAPAPVPPTQPGDSVRNLPSRSYGPFLNNDSRTLAEFGTELGRQITFTLDINTEPNADYVRVIDGEGKGMVLSGRQSRVFTKIALPVKIKFESDDSIKSKRVSIQKVVAFN